MPQLSFDSKNTGLQKTGKKLPVSLSLTISESGVNRQFSPLSSAETNRGDNQLSWIKLGVEGDSLSWYNQISQLFEHTYSSLTLISSTNVACSKYFVNGNSREKSISALSNC